tara:strand:- start:318 stop:596 length:279 start_codon:yes stop_codon:yes gene_type:complete
MVESISLEQLKEQQAQLSQTVGNLTAQKATLEEQLENVRNSLATNNGALQYATALIQSIDQEDSVDVGGDTEAEEIPLTEPNSEVSDGEVVL